MPSIENGFKKALCNDAYDLDMLSLPLTFFFRSVGFSLAVIFGRIGSILAPQVNYLHKVSNHIPYTIYGVLAILSALACIFLKDTYETPLEDYLQDNRTNKV